MQILKTTHSFQEGMEEKGSKYILICFLRVLCFSVLFVFDCFCYIIADTFFGWSVGVDYWP